jgi:hypothetical protein
MLKTTLKQILSSRGYGAASRLAEELDKQPQTIWKRSMEGATVEVDGTIRSGAKSQPIIGKMKLSDEEIDLIWSEEEPS